MKQFCAGVIVGISVLLSGCNASWMTSSDALRTARMERYRTPVDTQMLQPGDRITVQLHKPELETFSKTIDDNGCITLPMIDSVKIGGLSSSKAEDLVKHLYISKNIFKDGAIQVAIVPPVREFYVEGRVNRPGSYQFSRPITLEMAISMAGGRDEFADTSDVKLKRNGRVQMLDMRKDGNRMVEAGDIIEVPRGLM